MIWLFCAFWLLFSHSVLSDSLQPHGLQDRGFPVLYHLPEQQQQQQQSLLKLMSIESMMTSNNFILCHPLLLLPTIFPSIRVFSESVLRIRWPKYWSFSFIVTPSNEYSGLVSFRMDWVNLFAVQETQGSSPTPQFKSINSSVISLLYGPALTPIHDYWKNHSFD